ncbi:polyunsaturated fatty acid 5-lipoxygenase-like isoform X2 [Brienomyrus brachyistius]|uniref:polyunsaturated fatty acid 5-lipoxygenase-like isoform X2 n=1 Tax=Brienomyrus brachyistius TaxID=42636 RepID=UPI0020B3E28F|nr:polyunsaturated fatty acid 5-lipoxygenase-like isoform X2 [Brienomyrus brachyistius]
MTISTVVSCPAGCEPAELVGWASPPLSAPSKVAESQNLTNTFSLMSLAKHHSSGIISALDSRKRSKLANKMKGCRAPSPTISPQYSENESQWNPINGLIRFLVIFQEKMSRALNTVHTSGLPSFVDEGRFVMLPENLWFGPLKLLTLFKNFMTVTIQTLLRRLGNFGRTWSKIDDIKRVFLFPSKRAVYISENWKDDAFFGSQFLNGCNPGMIEKCTEFPEKIPEITKVYPNIKELIQNGKIYMVDYKLLDDVKEGVIDGHQQYLAAPIVLLQETDEGLMPIAIQLKQEPGKENPIFTPNDKPEAWLLAKIWVRNSDFYLHELISHLLRTHLLAEVFFFSIFTSLHDEHPILRILAATGRYTIPINVTARATLTNDTGFFMKYTAFGKAAQWEVLQRAFSQVSYKSLCLPDNLESRGVQNLTNYYYREDALAIWDAISEFLLKVIDTYYKDDHDIRRDTELQNFFSYTYHYGLQGKTDLPQSVETKAEAVKYLSMVMFTCSAQHAAVNHAQYDTYAWMPNGPTTMRQPPPKHKDLVDEQYIVKTLPGLAATLEAMSVSRFLSQVSKDFVALGTYVNAVSSDPRLRDSIKKFQTRLKAIGKAIKERSKEQPFPYEYLYPAGIENSIAI